MLVDVLCGVWAVMCLVGYGALMAILWKAVDEVAFAAFMVFLSGLLLILFAGIAAGPALAVAEYRSPNLAVLKHGSWECTESVRRWSPATKTTYSACVQWSSLRR